MCLLCLKAHRDSHPRTEAQVARQRLLVNRHSRTIQGRYGKVAAVAARRQLPCDITFSQYTTLIGGGGCHYCQGSLPATGHGLDRKDSDLGYTFDNCVPCCWDCNRVKSDRIPYDDMVKFIGPALRQARLAKQETTMSEQDPDRVATQTQWIECVTDVSIEICPETGVAQLMLRKIPIRTTVMVGDILEGEEEE